MKAIIVKNNDFKTVGFEVTASGNTLLSWGVAPVAIYFCKEVSVNDWMTEIFELVNLKAKISEQDSFPRNFFQCLENSITMEDGVGYDLGYVDRQKTANIERMKNIIENII